VKELAIQQTFSHFLSNTSTLFSYSLSNLAEAFVIPLKEGWFT
jgi:hypothetical protein